MRCDKVLVICIMAFWSWSTLQFTLVLTAAKARRTRAVGLYSGAEDTSRVPSPIVVVEEEVEKEGLLKKYQLSHPVENRLTLTLCFFLSLLLSFNQELAASSGPTWKFGEFYQRLFFRTGHFWL